MCAHTNNVTERYSFEDGLRRDAEDTVERIKTALRPLKVRCSSDLTFNIGCVKVYTGWFKYIKVFAGKVCVYRQTDMPLARIIANRLADEVYSNVTITCYF